jgi:hypothetical protein
MSRSFSQIGPSLSATAHAMCKRARHWRGTRATRSRCVGLRISSIKRPKSNWNTYHYLSNRAYADYDALIDAGGEADRSLTQEMLKSICATSWLTPENES